VYTPLKPGAYWRTSMSERSGGRWNLFIRLVNPHKHHEAITGRPLLHGVAIQAVLTRLAAFLSALKSTAEQLTDTERLRVILRRAFAKFMRATAGPPALLASEMSEM